ncbi:MAG TPA: ThuA domain-containing protein [Verrucomicrobiae bacterium]|jgi:type 1 glutamine amidotransferase|nr:ThuA domain-containing protein [Verrucomicrobiae bacterium]
MFTRLACWLLVASIPGTFSTVAAPLKVLIIDGQNNHDWKATTPVLRQILEDTAVFSVEVATSPPANGDMKSFRPNFSAYRVIVSNYNGVPWSDETKRAFLEYVRGGGGFVSVHAADNAFPEWKEYNEMIGLGGWGDRNETSGPYLRLRDGVWVQDISKGRGGSHGDQHPFVLDTREPTHPIMAGLPAQWMHAKDELYDRLRGPGGPDLTVLASAFSSKETHGSGEHEPLLMCRTYGQGRVFHTALGHGLEAIRCLGFATTFQRGTEWAATGKVTQKAPPLFPTADKVSSRTP